MSKENNSNLQTGSHREGPMNNTPPGSNNNSQGLTDMMGGREGQRVQGTRQEGEEGRFEETGSETDSQRNNINEDEGIRGGQSSM
jgi:hypothetical protein